jgi:hypothetical protein
MHPVSRGFQSRALSIVHPDVVPSSGHSWKIPLSIAIKGSWKIGSAQTMDRFIWSNDSELMANLVSWYWPTWAPIREVSFLQVTDPATFEDVLEPGGISLLLRDRWPWIRICCFCFHLSHDKFVKSSKDVCYLLDIIWIEPCQMKKGLWPATWRMEVLDSIPLCDATCSCGCMWPRVPFIENGEPLDSASSSTDDPTTPVFSELLLRRGTDFTVHSGNQRYRCGRWRPGLTLTARFHRRSVTI